MGRLTAMDPIEIAGELYDRAREVTQMAVGEAKRFAASEQGRRIRHNVATGLIVAAPAVARAEGCLEPAEHAFGNDVVVAGTRQIGDGEADS